MAPKEAIFWVVAVVVSVVLAGLEQPVLVCLLIAAVRLAGVAATAEMAVRAVLVRVAEQGVLVELAALEHRVHLIQAVLQWQKCRKPSQRQQPIQEATPQTVLSLS